MAPCLTPRRIFSSERVSKPPYSYRNDDAVPDFKDDKPIIVFDGYCVLCSGFANFVMRHDTSQRLRLLAAQSELGEALYTHFGLKPDDYSTNLLIENGAVRTKSDGTMAVFSYLGWPWKALNIARILPRAIADAVYNLIARNRLNWFGRKDQCYLPPANEKDRFL